MSFPRAYGAAAAIGFLAGLRPLTAAALVSRAAASRQLPIPTPGLRLMGSGAASKLFLALAAEEFIVDKLPYTPNRIAPGPLTGRIASGGVCGAAICAAKGHSVTVGALAAGLGAIAGSFAGYHVRKHFVQKRRAPALGCAVVEDALALGGGLAALARLKQR